MAPATLREVLATHVARAPGAPLLIAPEPGLTLTYAGLVQEALALHRSLAERGLAPGDKVGFLLHNGYRTASIFLGAMIGGYVIAPFNLLAQRSHLAFSLGHSDCRVLFTTRDQLERVDEALADVEPERRGAIEVVSVDVDAPGARAAGAAASTQEALAALGALAALSPTDPALLMYTSGTTGMPKGALLSHANLLAAARSVAAWHDLGPRDRVLSSLPLYHINGQSIATVTPFVSGGSIVAPHRFSVSSWWALVEAHRPTWLNMVPTIIAYLLNAAQPDRRYAFPSVRFGRSASAPLPPEQHRAFEQTFGVPVIEAMGMTESASVVFCNPQEASRRKYGTPGLPCGVEAKVVDPADPQCAPLADGATGELMLRGPNVMSGYYKAPELTARSLTAEGWLRTGDLGHRDVDGFYFVTGRLKELIIKGGENIAPREIDEALLRHPSVLEAAAVGILDPDYGQEIMACVVLKPDALASEEELRTHCLRELGRYKTPKLFRFVGELPKGPSGKVQRLKLVELF